VLVVQTYGGSVGPTTSSDPRRDFSPWFDLTMKASQLQGQILIGKITAFLAVSAKPKAHRAACAT